MTVRPDPYLIASQVLMGFLSRDQLLRFTGRVRVHVAVALMLAAGRQFLDDDYAVRGSYSPLLYRLLPSRESPDQLCALSRQNGLHRYEREGRRTFLTPSPELLSLIAQAKPVPVRKFFSDARMQLDRDLQPVRVRATAAGA